MHIDQDTTHLQQMFLWQHNYKALCLCFYYKFVISNC